MGVADGREQQNNKMKAMLISMMVFLVMAGMDPVEIGLVFVALVKLGSLIGIFG